MHLTFEELKEISRLDTEIHKLSCEQDDIRARAAFRAFSVHLHQSIKIKNTRGRPPKLATIVGVSFTANSPELRVRPLKQDGTPASDVCLNSPDQILERL